MSRHVRIFADWLRRARDIRNGQVRDMVVAAVTSSSNDDRLRQYNAKKPVGSSAYERNSDIVRGLAVIESIRPSKESRRLAREHIDPTAHASAVVVHLRKRSSR